MSTIFIGMGTCGLATGAGEVKTAVEKWAAARAAKVKITPTGCIGYCKAEPIMDVVADDGHSACPTETSRPRWRGSSWTRSSCGRTTSSTACWDSSRTAQHRFAGIPLIEEHPYFRKQVKYVLRNCGVIDPESIADYRAHGGFKGFERAMGMSRRQVIQEVTRSGLRGRGGSGFLTGKKWELALASKNEKKYVICNADEGDPGRLHGPLHPGGRHLRGARGHDASPATPSAPTRGSSTAAPSTRWPSSVSRRPSRCMKSEGLLEKPIGERDSFSPCASRWARARSSAARRRRSWLLLRAGAACRGLVLRSRRRRAFPEADDREQRGNHGERLPHHAGRRRELLRHGHAELEGHQGVRPHGQGGQRRPRGGAHGHHAPRDRLRHRRGHPRRKGVQGGADRRALGRLHPGRASGHQDRLRIAESRSAR